MCEPIGYLDCLTVAVLAGFAPWIVYWVLIGNVPFKVAVLAALAAAVLSFAVGRVKGASGRTLELGVIGTFVVLTMAGMQEARRVAGPAAPRLMAAMTAAFAIGQLLGPVVVSAMSSSAQALRTPSIAAAVLLVAGAAVLTWSHPPRNALSGT